MKKVILSMVCMFAISTIVNATSLRQIDCVEMAMEVGNWAERDGKTQLQAWEEASEAYQDCVDWQS